ncbi:hypothetical protein BDV11DRAFT_201348 [Aspergillus similis]
MTTHHERLWTLLRNQLLDNDGKPRELDADDYEIFFNDLQHMNAVWLQEHDDLDVEIPLPEHVLLKFLLHVLELVLFVYRIRGE